MKYKHQRNYNILNRSIDRRLDELNFSGITNAYYLHNKLLVILPTLTPFQRTLIIYLFLCYYSGEKDTIMAIREGRVLNLTHFWKIISNNDIVVEISKFTLIISRRSDGLSGIINIIME